MSALAPNAAPYLRAIVDWTARATGLPLMFDDLTPWPDSEADLYRGAAAFGFVCGLPYVLEAHCVEALAAPVMTGARYGGKPIYFSDLVVRKESRFLKFEDLRGTSFVYNEPGSHSGYNIVRYHLAQNGHCGKFFSRVTGSGSHQ
ncbi:MAG: PhnD/SsuA/transferrin family substrate-binding protein, partial [Candidatus Sericytochromatia bacterium]|nr:PhnD/SsuA/transferrin family substrate-binding protein [Candidatus Tanganyikabacteria bacterium]